MERFNYPNLAAVYAEDVEILRLMEIVDTYGAGKEKRQELADLESQVAELKERHDQ